MCLLNNSLLTCNLLEVHRAVSAVARITKIYFKLKWMARSTSTGWFLCKYKILYLKQQKSKMIIFFFYQLDAQTLILIHLLHSRTCFEHYCAHLQEDSCIYTASTGLFKMIVGVQLSSGNSAQISGNNHHLTIPFEGGMHSLKRQGACVSRNWKYESEPPLKPSPLTCGTNSNIVLMFVESQRMHI